MASRRFLVVLAVLVLLLGAAAQAAGGFVRGIAYDNLDARGFDRGHTWEPWDFGLVSENVSFQSSMRSPAVTLAGWWIAAQPDSDHMHPTVVLVHGLGSNMSRVMRQWAPMLHAAGYDVLTFDLANHGASGNTADRFVSYGMGESLDVRAAIAYARERRPQAPVVLYGGSMGAASVMLANNDANAVIEESGYAGLRFQAHLDGDKKGYPRFLTDWVLEQMDAQQPLEPSKANPAEALESSSVPLLLMHCENDSRIPVDNLDELLRHAPAARTTVWRQPCPGPDSSDHHVDGWLVPGYNETVLRFLDTVPGLVWPIALR